MIFVSIFAYGQKITWQISTGNIIERTLYLGVPNHIEIMVENAPAKSISLKTNNGLIEAYYEYPNSSRKFRITPDHIGETMVYVYKNQTIFDSIKLFTAELEANWIRLGGKKPETHYQEIKL